MSTVAYAFRQCIPAACYRIFPRPRRASSPSSSRVTRVIPLARDRRESTDQPVSEILFWRESELEGALSAEAYRSSR